jgi:hypothetical protein
VTTQTQYFVWSSVWEDYEDRIHAMGECLASALYRACKLALVPKV